MKTETRTTAALPEDALYWLFLARLCGTRLSDFRKLLRHCPDPRAIILDSDEAQRRRCGIGPVTLDRLRAGSRQRHRHPDWQQATREFAELQRLQAQLLLLGSQGYPRLLAEIHDPPPLLYMIGDPEALLRPQYAVVGSRRCTPGGERAATELAGALAAAGFSVCSGLALGIDAMAHRAALAAGGSTVAVMATGLDQCYPHRHRDLAAAIRRSGALVTEFPLSTPPRRDHFPRRNRLISGMSVGVLVVEAGLKSGSLITARLALEQNREVLAVPHSIYHPGGRGCLQLLRDGATLVEGIDDLLSGIGSLSQLVTGPGPSRESIARPTPEPPPSARVVWRHLGYEPQSVDGLVSSGAGDAASVLAALAELELEGLVERHGGLYMRCV